MIRPAMAADASRIAEILVFAKRVNYRDIFRDDRVSFGIMQVYPLAKEYIDNPNMLKNVWVYDDAFVKGMIHIDGTQIVELYVDSFFANMGVGSALIQFAIERKKCDCLWVLEKNTRAMRFYEKHGFVKTESRKPEEGTKEFIVQMKR